MMNTIAKTVVNDLMQQGYCYELVEAPGANFDDRFLPQLTPKQMLAMGVFGGKYMTDCKEEFPADWFEHAKLSPGSHDASLNFFQVKASKPLSYWRQKGWIYEDDPRGWFQWYCRYFMGRRHEDDQRQIGRWDDAIGKAFFIGDSSVGQLKVSFFGPFYGAYNIVALDQETYQWSLVVGPDTDYLWILARNTKLEKATIDQILSTARSYGFDTDELIYVEHDQDQAGTLMRH